jgi:two-component system NarL family sensor kinase
VAAVLAQGDPLLEPLGVVLVVAAVTANLAEVHFKRSVWISGTFISYLLAAGLLGPAPTVAVVLSAEGLTWLLRRTRPLPALGTAASIVVPATAAALLIKTYGRGDPAEDLKFALVLGGAALLALVAHSVLLSGLMALGDAVPIRSTLDDMRELAPMLAGAAILTVLVGLGYREFGLVATTFGIVVLLAFNYAVRLWVSARDRAVVVADLAAERGRLVAQALAAEERERQALAEVLHDEVLQTLLVAGQELAQAQEGDHQSLNRAREAIRTTADQVRSAMFELHPAVLERAGLRTALQELAAQEAVRGEFETTLHVGLDAEGVADRLIFSVARELLRNAAKHAGAGVVAISVRRYPNELALEVRDDGRGFDVRNRDGFVRAGHVGLASSAERIRAVGGEFEIRSSPEQGTYVRANVPL